MIKYTYARCVYCFELDLGLSIFHLHLQMNLPEPLIHNFRLVFLLIYEEILTRIQIIEEDLR